MRTHRSTSAAALIACTLLAGAAAGQEIKFEKYTLANGMTVILHEDHSTPIAGINIWYRVGSQDEPPGRSGFAHLFEHLMFMGTQRVPGNQFDIIMETGGGANNADTDFHRTDYYSFGPSSLLPTLLWLDADRLEDMGLNMSQEKLDKQRDVVRNELRQTIENTPYGKAEDFVFQLAFPRGHPMHYSVAGTHEDLEAATVTNVKDFFANFYVPANASLVVAGDFDPAKIKPLINNLFGSIPAAPAPTPRTYEQVNLGNVIRYTMIDKVDQPMVFYTYHSAPAFSPGDADLHLAADILAGGESSRLYTRLVRDEELAAEVDATQSSYPLGSLFQVRVRALPGADLEKIEKITDEEIAHFVADGPTPDELERRKRETEFNRLRLLQSIQERAVKLNEYEYYFSDPGSFKRDLDRYREATTVSVRRACREWLSPDARVMMRILPEEPARAPSARDQRPEDFAFPSFTPPLPAVATLKNGMTLAVWERHDLPLVSWQFIVAPRAGLDPAGQAGVTSLAAEMLSQGTKDLDAVAFDQMLQSLGADFNARVDHESATASMTVLAAGLNEAAPLFAEAVLRPRMDPADFSRIRTLRLAELRQRDQNPGALAAKLSSKLYFRDGPYATPAEGTVETVGAVTLDAVKAAHRTVFDPARGTLLVAGDITLDAAKALFEPLLGMQPAKGSPVAFQKVTPPALHNGLQVAIVDRPGAVQTVISFRAPGVPYTDASRPGRELLTTIIGGSFTSRLNQNLREVHGYTYGARAGFDFDPSLGTFIATSAVRADVTGAALGEFMKEFARLRPGDITEAEATKARLTVANDTAERFGTLASLLRHNGTLVTSGLAFTATADDLAAITNVTASDLNTLAAKAVAIDQGVLVLVGDKGVILEQIKDLGLPKPVDLAPDGAAAKSGKPEDDPAN